MKKYDIARPALTADQRRAIEVESGHACAVSRCGEHTYLEIHHVNQNREDNRLENLVLLCDKHHKMAENGIIDRKALREYKKLLRESYATSLAERVRRLESLLADGRRLESEKSPEQIPESNSDPDLPSKSVVARSQLMHMTLEQLALARFERDCDLRFERQPTFTRGNSQLRVDAIRQDDGLAEDIVVEVRWLRKRYLDSPVWVYQVDAATSAYELITGRKCRGVMIYVVPKDSMKQLEDLPLTANAIDTLQRKPQLVIYTYSELGFDPGPLSVELFASNLES